MKLETTRLLLRELTLDDVEYMFQLDSNPVVQQFCEGSPATSPEVSRDNILRIRTQYEQNGIGRLIVFIKETNEFIGWAGLKLEHGVNNHESFIDLGYRILPQYWNRGYMTEASKELIKFGFEELKCDKICGYVLTNNPASSRVLEKVGLKFKNVFMLDGEENAWYEITKDEYNKRDN